ncbi:hypothetical protein [Streptomyces sp. NPDC050538]|uniref:hypothetical protein n=1 Tax=Streptomyces sp. NPDC050538 TaxID=3365627 RepID=UPI00378C1076
MLRPARLDTTVQKMRCLQSTNRIRAELAGEIEREGILVRTAMSRGQGCHRSDIGVRAYVRRARLGDLLTSAAVDSNTLDAITQVRLAMSPWR